MQFSYFLSVLGTRYKKESGRKEGDSRYRSNPRPSKDGQGTSITGA
ncbi:hypothetical protein QFZ96_001773 [Paraburkholderia youngii]